MEVEKALKPYYAHGEISKEDYKSIYNRAFEKVGVESVFISRSQDSLCSDHRRLIYF